MNTVDTRAFEFAMSHIKDGNIFERFAQELLCAILGYEFIPVGGYKDRGIDGIERCFEAQNVSRTIYQISIDKNPKFKVQRTLRTLKKNKIRCGRLFYVTNQTVSDQEALIDGWYEEFGVSVIFYDLAWLRGQINRDEKTVRTYLTFVDTYVHEFTTNTKGLYVEDLHSDPRIFVFLRQQWENRDQQTQLDEFLANTLILHALEGTDPDKDILRSRDEILERASRHVKFSLELLEPIIDQRLKALSTKPRKIKHHRQVDAYCLPYGTRLEVQQKKLEDVALHEAFFQAAEEKLTKHLQASSVKAQNATRLLNSVFNRLFREQGLEFANFVSKSSTKEAVEKSLSDIISATVDDSSVIPRNKESVKSALLGTVREIIYQGSYEEMEYLRRLSNTYMLLFLLQCEPKVSVYFSTMAGKLKVLVGNSILVPALSEGWLAPRHRRHWNLLVNANKAGVRLYIDRVTLKELWSHIQKTVRTYKQIYQRDEKVYQSELAIKYVDEIIIRSYLYGRLNGRLETFDEYIDQFVSLDAFDPKRDLQIWLKGTFGIQPIDEDVSSIPIDDEDLNRLSEELSKSKDAMAARNDARTILTLFALREKEQKSDDIYGYQTWWLSKDTTTQRAVQKCLGDKYKTRVYMRSDFLNNYIALSPHVEEVNRVFDTMFPTLVGVSISHHISPEISQAVQKGIRDHGSKNPARVRAIMADFSDRLKAQGGANQPDQMVHYLDECFSQLS